MLALTVTQIAAAAAALTWMVVEWLHRGKPTALGFATGLVAGLVFKRVWRLVSGDESAPEATDSRHGWGEILLAAAVQGAIFGLVKAAVDL